MPRSNTSRNSASPTASHGDLEIQPGDYVPATGTSLLLPWYDTLVSMMARESLLKSRMVDLILSDRPKEVLDVGCGTATLMLRLRNEAINRGQPCGIVGVDPDPAILAQATQKMTRVNDLHAVEVPENQGAAEQSMQDQTAFVDPSGHWLRLVEGDSNCLPFPSEHFAAVCSSLVMHHLQTNEKETALVEMQRVCKPGGVLVLADFCRPKNWLARLLFNVVRCFDGFDRTESNLRGALPAMMTQAGWTDVSETFVLSTVLGTIRCYKAAKVGRS